MTQIRVPSLGRLLLVSAAALVLAGCSGAGSTPSSAVSAPAAGPSTAIGSPSAPLPTPSSAPATPALATPAPTMATVRVYFWRGDGDPCTEVVPVDRTVATPTPEAALRALLAGPTPAETAAGYGSWFSSATADALLGVTVRDGVAAVSLRDLRPIIPNASSSCGSSALLGALDATLRALPGITSARYSFDGDEAAFYEWLQMGPPSP